MKSNIFLHGLIALGSVGLFGACASDYLDTTPEANFPDKDALSTVDNIQLALNGISLSMNTQYQSTSWNQYNGESYVNTICNEAMGQDYISGLAGAMFTAETIKGDNWNNADMLLNAIPWDYAYGLIQQANKILDVVDTAEGDEEMRAWVKAQALTYRAHSYVKLLQFYAPRWEDSNNGETYCLVKRTTGEIKNAPLTTMKDILDLVYEDLDNAIALYDQAGNNARDMKWMVDKSVAQGIYARVAMIKHDWQTAQKMAHDARQGYTIMDNDTYLSGFYADNNDNMWTSGSADEDIYYWSWGSHYAANGLYVKNWGVGAGAIDLDLYNQMDENDIRRQLYITPDKIAFTQSVNKAWNPGKLEASDYWDAKLVDATKDLNLAAGASSKKDADGDKWGLVNVTMRYCAYYISNIFKGNYNDCFPGSDNYMAYYATGQSGQVLLSRGVYGTQVVTPFGAQLKFIAKAPYGTSKYPYMRAAEMCLTEAEAAWHNNDMTTAQNCLKEINGKRISGYTCTATGEELLKEIQLSRRIELWGEGFGWSDFKRWNLPINRRAWVANDPTSGNWMPERAGVVETTKNHGWMFTLPNSESDYNDQVDRNLLPK